jgi:coatomer subunit beta'
MYLLGYIAKDNRLYLGDKELNIVSYSLQQSVLEYQTAIMRKDFNTADQVLPSIPYDQRTRVAHFLEKQSFKKQALAVTTDADHKFELALQLKDLRTSYDLAMAAESDDKWKQLGELAMAQCQFGLALECYHHAKNYSGLLLLATSAGDAQTMEKLAEQTATVGKHNIAFITNFLLGKLDECLELLVVTKRLPEAAFFARTYLPHEISRIVKLWKEDLSQTKPKVAQSLADPTEYANLFPEISSALLSEPLKKENIPNGNELDVDIDLSDEDIDTEGIDLDDEDLLGD